MKSIMQKNKECYITYQTADLHEHHIFGGRNRKLSEKYGLKVFLVSYLHNTSDNGVHGKNGRSLDIYLKRAAQKRAMERYGWTIADFAGVFGKNYLDEEWENVK